MLCPVDNIVCNRKYLQEIEIDVCSKCDGLWVEKSEVKKIITRLSAPHITSIDEELRAWEVAESAGTIPREFWVEDTLSCPRDGSVMQKHYFGGTHIGVDQCQVCKGFWFDGGELQAVATSAIPNPELERAYQMMFQDSADWEAELEKLKQIPATVVSSLTNPAYAIVLLGTFLLQVFLDYAKFSTAKSRNRNEE